MRPLIVTLAIAGALIAGAVFGGKSDALPGKGSGGLPRPGKGKCFVCRFSPNPEDASCATTTGTGYNYCLVEAGSRGCITLGDCEAGEPPDGDLEELP